MGHRAGRVASGPAIEDAERLLARFVRNVTRARRWDPVPAGAADETAGLDRSSPRPRRRQDEVTSPIHKSVEEPSLSRVARRRLLGQEAIGAVLGDDERRRFLVELAALHRHGHIDNVVAELETVRCRYPDDVELHGALVEFFFGRGDVPRATELLFAMVDVHFERRDPDAARRCLERVRHVDPSNRRLRSFERLLRPEDEAPTVSSGTDAPAHGGGADG